MTDSTAQTITYFANIALPSVSHEDSAVTSHSETPMKRDDDEDLPIDQAMTTTDLSMRRRRRKESWDWERSQYCREEALEGTPRSDTSRSDEQQDNHTQCDERQDLRAERDNRMHGAYTHPAIPLCRLGGYGHIF